MAAVTPLGATRSDRSEPQPGTRDQLGNGGILFLAPNPVPTGAVVLGDADAGLMRLLRLQASTVVVARDVRQLRAAGAAELIVIGGPAGARRIQRDRALRTHLAESLARGACVMAERGTRRGRPEHELLDDTSIHFRLFPRAGAMRAAAAVGDTRSADWLVEHGHAGRALVERRAEGVVRQIRGGLRGAMTSLSRRARAPATVGASTTAQPTSFSIPGRMGRTLSGAMTAGLVSVDLALERAGGARRELLLWGAASVPDWVTAAIGRPLDRAVLVVPGDFVTQKLLVALFADDDPEPTIIVKVARDPAVNDRVDTAADALRKLSDLSLGFRPDLPRLAAAGRVGHLAFVAEHAIIGRPLTDHDNVEEWLRPAASTLVDVAMASRHDVTGPELATAMAELLGSFGEVYRNDDVTLRWLDGQLDVIAAASRVPLVLQHGDPGSWNLLRRDASSVALLDWENADPHGIPVADLAFLLRSAGVLEARQHSRSVDRLGASMRAFVDPHLTAVGAELMGNLATAIELPRALIGPLFYHGWVLQALREARRLAPDQAERGIFVRSLRRLVAERSRPELQRLLLVTDT